MTNHIGCETFRRKLRKRISQSPNQLPSVKLTSDLTDDQTDAHVDDLTNAVAGHATAVVDDAHRALANVDPATAEIVDDDAARHQAHTRVDDGETVVVTRDADLIDAAATAHRTLTIEAQPDLRAAHHENLVSYQPKRKRKPNYQNSPWLISRIIRR